MGETRLFLHIPSSSRARKQLIIIIIIIIMFVNIINIIVVVVIRYAWECQTQEGGWGLDKTLRDSSWKFRGIVNGMDYSEWSPQHDVHLHSDGYQNYTQDNLREGKARCKEALQKVGQRHAALALACCIVAFGPSLLLVKSMPRSRVAQYLEVNS